MCIRDRPYMPEIETKVLDNGHITKLTYDCLEKPFYILTGNKNTRERQLDSGSLEDALINRLSNGDHTYDDLSETFSGSFKRKHSDDGFFHNTLIKSIFIEPNTSHIEYVMLSQNEPKPLSNEEYEAIYKNAKKGSEPANFNEAGKKYTLSTEILKSTLLTNVVYPVYRLSLIHI